MVLTPLDHQWEAVGMLSGSTSSVRHPCRTDNRHVDPPFTSRIEYETHLSTSSPRLALSRVRLKSPTRSLDSRVSPVDSIGWEVAFRYDLIIAGGVDQHPSRFSNPYGNCKPMKLEAFPGLEQSSWYELVVTWENDRTVIIVAVLSAFWSLHEDTSRILVLGL